MSPAMGAWYPLGVYGTCYPNLLHLELHGPLTWFEGPNYFDMS